MSESHPRYARQMLLPELGKAGQERLARGSVAIIGAGGLGSPAALYLAAAGVGRIGLIDPDLVDETNLHRQILYDTPSVGRPKSEAGHARLHALNPTIRIEAHPVRLSAANALEILGRFDVVLDGTDNFSTRYLVNDAAVLLGIPNVYGSVYRFEGQLSVFSTPDGPCYRCLHPAAPPPGAVPACGEAGVLGVLPGVIGTMQALETIKVLAGLGTSLAGRLLLFDALRSQFREMKLRRRCDEHERVTSLENHQKEESCRPMNNPEITPAELSARLKNGDDLEVIDVREPFEWEAGHIPEAKHIPLAQVPARIGEIDQEKEVVMVCRSGGRSGRAQDFLISQAGFQRVANMTGGMQRWAAEVDPTVRVL